MKIEGRDTGVKHVDVIYKKIIEKWDESKHVLFSRIIGKASIKAPQVFIAKMISNLTRSEADHLQSDILEGKITRDAALGKIKKIYLERK